MSKLPKNYNKIPENYDKKSKEVSKYIKLNIKHIRFSNTINFLSHFLVAAYVS